MQAGSPTCVCPLFTGPGFPCDALITGEDFLCNDCRDCRLGPRPALHHVVLHANDPGGRITRMTHATPRKPGEFIQMMVWHYSRPDKQDYVRYFVPRPGEQEGKPPSIPTFRLPQVT